MIYFQVFAGLWILMYILALFEYAVIVGICTWYFTSNSETGGTFSLAQGFGWGLWYNAGSLAFGSFILTVVILIRITLEFIDNQTKKV